MNGPLLNAALALVWMLLIGDFSLRQLVLGLLLGYLVLRLFPRALGSASYVRSLHSGLSFTFHFLRELTFANVQVALFALQKRPPLRPVIVQVPLLSKTDTQRTLLAATITLMPGTVAMGFSPDRRVMYAHAIGTPDAEAARQSIIKVEREILGVIAPRLLTASAALEVPSSEEAERRAVRDY